MATTGFVRQLGAQSGVQLNPLQDDSSFPTPDNYDQVIAIAMRATRGRIDKPFLVNAGNVFNKLGLGEQIRVSALNEAWVHVVEALNNGAYQFVVQRLTAAPTAQFVATVSNTTTINVTSVSSGTLVAGQPINGQYILPGTTISSFGTFNGTSGAIILSQAAAPSTSTPNISLAQGGPLIQNIVAFDPLSQNSTGVVLGTPTISFPSVGFSGGGGGSGASATPILSSTGAITGFNIVPGSGYSGTVTASISGGSGAGAVLGTVTLSGGGISAIAITSGGSGYGQLATIPITSGGAGFGVVPSVTISGGGGNGAAAVPVLTNGVITSFTITGGAGYSSVPTVVVNQAPQFAVLTDWQLAALTVPYVFSIKHLGCHNDGIQINWQAQQIRNLGANLTNSVITINVLDSSTPGVNLYSFTGSLIAGTLDDYGNSYYLPDVISGITDAVIFNDGTINNINPVSMAYGYNAITGQPNWAQSGVQIAFTEGSKAYVATDYENAVNALQNTTLEYGYISSGGTQSSSFLYWLSQLAYQTNCPMAFDVYGTTPDAVISFVEQLNLGANPTPHLMWAYWTMFQSLDPTGLNGQSYIGTATLNLAYACARNAVQDTNGFAKKNYPIAGPNHPVNRQRITQFFSPDAQGQVLNSLAVVKINPVMYQPYAGGGLYVYFDSLTSAPVNNSERKLISVADMAESIDYDVTLAAKANLQLPIDITIKRLNDFLKDLFTNALTAGWLTVSTSQFMQGQAFQYTVTPNTARPYDTVDIKYWLRYTGTTRAIFVTQTLSK